MKRKVNTKMENMLNQWIAEEGLKPLDAEEEKRLVFRIRKYNILKKKLESGNRKPDGREKKELYAGRKAFQTLVLHAVPLGIRYARRYAARYPGLSLTCEDLEQEAFLGIMHAAGLYCPDMGTKFSTYAVYWIEQYIRRAIEDKGDIIRKPASAHSRLRMLKSFGPDVTAAEISGKTGISESEIAFLQGLNSTSLISLEDTGNSNEEADEVRKEIADPKDYREIAEDNVMKDQLRGIIRSISNENQRTVMEMHLGLNRNNICFSNRQISSALGMKLSDVTGIISRTVRELVFWNSCMGLPGEM